MHFVVLLQSFISIVFQIDQVSSNIFIDERNSPSAFKHRPFDCRKTISRSRIISIYNSFAISGHIGGKDASSGYGGPAIQALTSLAKFGIYDDESIQDKDQNASNRRVQRVLDYGCGQGKLAEYVFDSISPSTAKIDWHGIDSSPEMIKLFQQRLERFRTDGFIESTCQLLKDGDPSQLLQTIPVNYFDRFVSTYCLDLLSEEDIYSVLALAEHSLRSDGKLLLAGITYGYGNSIRTFLMTLGWEMMYRIRPDVVGGCRPQILAQYLEEKGWNVEKIVRTLPVGFPWMVSEVICATPPLNNK